GDKLYRDRGARIHALEIMNQLREVLDRIDVVVRRRRDERDTGRRVARPRDHLVHLVTGELTAFTRLRALRDFDLELRRGYEVFRGHAEASRCHLLDRAVAFRAEPRALLSTLAGIAATAEAIHRDGERIVRLAADGSGWICTGYVTTYVQRHGFPF